VTKIRYQHVPAGIRPILLAPGRRVAPIPQAPQLAAQRGGDAVAVLLQMVGGHVLRGLVDRVERGGVVDGAASALPQTQVSAVAAPDSNLTQTGLLFAALHAVVDIVAGTGKVLEVLADLALVFRKEDGVGRQLHFQFRGHGGPVGGHVGDGVTDLAFNLSVGVDVVD